MKIVFANKLIEPLTTIAHCFLHLGINNELELFRLGKIRSSRIIAGGSKVNLVRSKGAEDEFIHAKSGRSVHAGVFAKESRDPVIADNDWDVESYG